MNYPGAEPFASPRDAHPTGGGSCLVSLGTVPQKPFTRQASGNVSPSVIQAEITRYSLEKNMTVIIIADETSYIQSGILNDLKMLFNFEMDSKDRAIVILTGLSSLNNILQKSPHESLRQRIIMNYHLDDLSEVDGRKYIKKNRKNYTHTVPKSL